MAEPGSVAKISSPFCGRRFTSTAGREIHVTATLHQEPDALRPAQQDPEEPREVTFEQPAGTAVAVAV